MLTRSRHHDEARCKAKQVLMQDPWTMRHAHDDCCNVILDGPRDAHKPRRGVEQVVFGVNARGIGCSAVWPSTTCGMNLHGFECSSRLPVTAWVTKWLNQCIFTISELTSGHPFGPGAASKEKPKTQQNKAIPLQNRVLTSRQGCNHDCTRLALCVAISFCED